MLIHNFDTPEELHKFIQSCEYGCYNAKANILIDPYSVDRDNIVSNVGALWDITSKDLDYFYNLFKIKQKENPEDIYYKSTDTLISFIFYDEDGTFNLDSPTEYDDAHADSYIEPIIELCKISSLTNWIKAEDLCYFIHIAKYI